MNRFIHFLEYVALRLMELVVWLLPRRAALAFGGTVGSLLRIMGVYRHVVATNMAHVALWSSEEQKRIVARLYRNMGRYAADFLRRHPEHLPHDFERMEMIDRALSRGKGVIAVLGHFGNWEVLGALFGSRLQSLHVVAMPMANPLVERWLARKRARTGIVEIEKSKAVRRMLRALRDNNIVAILIDQNARRHGTLVPFLGKPASTIRTVAGLMQKTGCVVLLAYALLGDDGRYRIHVEEGRDLGVSSENADEFIDAYQREHNDVLSRWIQQYPEHWFGWFHRRYAGLIPY